MHEYMQMKLAIISSQPITKGVCKQPLHHYLQMYALMFLHHFFTLHTSSCFEACGVQRFHSQEFCAWDQFCILPRTKKSVYGIVSYLNFLITEKNVKFPCPGNVQYSSKFHFSSSACHFTLHLERKLEHVGHKWVISGLLCGLVDQVGQWVWPPFNPVLAIEDKVLQQNFFE